MENGSALFQEAAKPIAEPVGGITRVAGRRRFLVGENFRVGEVGGVAFAHIDPIIRERLGGIVESDIGPDLLREQRLIGRVNNQSAIALATGSSAGPSVAFAHVFEFLRTAERRRWFNFLVADLAGELLRMIVFPHYHGWWVRGREFTDSERWYIGDRLVSYC